MSKGMSHEEIKRLGLLKWQIIIDHNGLDEDENEQFPFKSVLPKELQELENECSYCEEFLKEVDYDRDCSLCPLNEGFPNGCYNHEHTFDRWRYDSTIENAQAIYDLIQNTPFPNES